MLKFFSVWKDTTISSANALLNTLAHLQLMQLMKIFTFTFYIFLNTFFFSSQHFCVLCLCFVLSIAYFRLLKGFKKLPSRFQVCAVGSYKRNWIRLSKFSGIFIWVHFNYSNLFLIFLLEELMNFPHKYRKYIGVILFSELW